MPLTDNDFNRITAIVNDAVDHKLSATEARLKGELATKAELSRLATKADFHGLATTNDLNGLATKADLDRLEGRQVAAAAIVERDYGYRLDGLETRIDRLENAAPHSA